MANSGPRKRRRTRKRATPAERRRLEALRRQFGLGEFAGRGARSTRGRSTPRTRGGTGRVSRPRATARGIVRQSGLSIRRLVEPGPGMM